MGHYSHPTTPQSTVPSPGAASMNSMQEEYEINSPTWPRTPASPVRHFGSVVLFFFVAFDKVFFFGLEKFTSGFVCITCLLCAYFLSVCYQKLSGIYYKLFVD